LVENLFAAGGHHGSPFRQGRLSAEAEEAEAGGGQDDAGHIERGADDHRRNAHGRYLPRIMRAEDAPCRRAAAM
jgi:hypothetical protein